MYIVNPLTGRQISTNSRTYKVLEREGILNTEMINKKKNVLYEAQTREDAVTAKKNIKNVNPKKTLIVKGTNVVQVNKRLKQNDYRDKIIDVEAGLLPRLQKLDLSDVSEEDTKKYLKNEIYKHLVVGNDFEPIPVSEVKRQPVRSNQLSRQPQGFSKKKIITTKEKPKSRFKIKEISDYETDITDNYDYEQSESDANYN